MAKGKVNTKKLKEDNLLTPYEKVLERFSVRPDLKRLAFFHMLMGKNVLVHTTYGDVAGKFFTANGAFIQIELGDGYVEAVMIPEIRGIRVAKSDLCPPPPPVQAEKTDEAPEQAEIEEAIDESVEDGGDE